jgi:hypothetical protein
MDWTNIIIALVALYGAILSTYTLITQLRRDRFRVRVQISRGIFPLASGNEMVFLSASNPGQKAVTLDFFGFILPDKQRLLFPNFQSNREFPYELLPGKSCKIWIELTDVVSTLKKYRFTGKVKLRGYYKDQVDNLYKSKPFKFDVGAEEK